jgi:hypothetical protein
LQLNHFLEHSSIACWQSMSSTHVTVQTMLVFAFNNKVLTYFFPFIFETVIVNFVSRHIRTKLHILYLRFHKGAIAFPLMFVLKFVWLFENLREIETLALDKSHSRINLHICPFICLARYNKWAALLLCLTEMGAWLSVSWKSTISQTKEQKLTFDYFVNL